MPELFDGVRTDYLCQTLLTLYKLDLLKDVDQLWYHTTVARELVNRVRSPQDAMPADSPVHLAMDAYIARRLPNFMPIRVTEIPPLEQIWDSLDAFLKFWAEVGHLVTSPSVLLWKVSSRSLDQGHIAKKGLDLSRLQGNYDIVYKRSQHARSIGRCYK